MISLQILHHVRIPIKFYSVFGRYLIIMSFNLHVFFLSNQISCWERWRQTTLEYFGQNCQSQTRTTFSISSSGQISRQIHIKIPLISHLILIDSMSIKRWTYLFVHLGSMPSHLLWRHRGTGFLEIKRSNLSI